MPSPTISLCSQTWEVAENASSEIDHLCSRGHAVGEAHLDRLALADDRAAVRRDDAAVLGELPLAAAPAVHETDPLKDGRERCHAQAVEQPDQHELAVAFLPHVVAQQA